MFKKVKPYSKYVLDAVTIIKQHIEDNPFAFKSSTELLDHLCTPHRNSVEKAFKDLYSSHIKAYQIKQRMHHAKGFLQEGQSKKTVAIKCFYKSSSAFSSAFRKEFSMSPTDWTNSRKNNITRINRARR